MPDVKYIITADESGALASVKRVNDEVAKASTSGSSAVGGLTGAFGSLRTMVGSVGALFGGLAIASIIREQAVAATNFQREWTKVQVILRDDQGGAEALEKFKQQVLDLPPVFGTAADNAKAFYQIISSGYSDPREALILLKAAAVAAAGGFTETEVAVRTGAAVLQAYGLQVTDAQHVFDIMAKTVDLGVISFEELASQLGNVIPIAAANNVSFEEVAASIAAMTLQGVPAALAVTGLRSTIASLLEPSKEAQEVAQKLGLHWNAAGLKALGLQGVLGELNQKGVKVTSEDIAKLTGRIEATNFVMAATSEKGAKNLTNALDQVKKSSDGAGASAASLAAAMNSPTTRWKEFVNTVGNASSKLGSEFAPAASKTLVMLTDIVKGASEGIPVLNGLTVAAIALVVAMNFSVIGAAMRGLVAIVASLTAAFTGWGGLLANIAGGFSTMAASIWTSVTASVALQSTLIAMTGFGAVALAAGLAAMALIDYYDQVLKAGVASEDANASALTFAANLAKSGKDIPGFAANVTKAVREFQASGDTSKFQQDLVALQEELKRTNPEAFFKESAMKKQQELMKALGTDTVQSYKASYEAAKQNFDKLTALRSVPKSKEDQAELEANIRKAEVLVAMRKKTLDEALGKKGGAGDKEAMEKILKAREAIDEGIANLNQKSLTGLQAQFSEIDQSLNKLLKNKNITPDQVEKAQAAAVAARMQAVQEEADAEAKLKAEADNKEFDRVKEGMARINALQIESDKRRLDAQKDIASLSLDTRLALATNESERMAIENQKQLEDFQIKYQGIDNYATLSNEFRLALEMRSAAILQKQHEERVRNLQDDIAVLRAETGGPGPSLFGFTNRQVQDNAEIQKLKVEQEIRYNKAVRDGAMESELQLIQQKEGLELLRLQQTQYDRMFDTVKGQAEGVFDAIFTRGKKGFDGLLEYIKGVFAVKVKEIFGNLVARLFTGERPGAGGDATGGILGSVFGAFGIRRPPSAEQAASKEITDAIKGSTMSAAKMASENSCMCFQKGIEELKPAPESGGLLAKAAGIIGGVGGGVGALIGLAGKASAAGPVGGATVTLTTEAGEVIGGLGAAGSVLGSGGALTGAVPQITQDVFGNLTLGAGGAGGAAGGGLVGGAPAGTGASLPGGGAPGGLLSGGLGSIGKFLSGGMSGTMGTVGALTAGIGGGFLGGYGTGRLLQIGGKRSAIAGAVGAGAGALATAFLGPVLGGIIGAGVGAATAGLFRIFGGKNMEAILGSEIQRDFGINVTDGKVLKMIKQAGESAFGKDFKGKRFETLRLDSVQQMLLSYATQTGQDPSKLPIYQSFYGTGKVADNERINISGGGSAVGSNILGGAATGGANVGGGGIGGVIPGAVDRFTGNVGSTGGQFGRVNVSGGGGVMTATQGGQHIEQTVAPIIYINGAKDPNATGRAVATAVAGVANNARRELVKDLTVAMGRDEGRKQFREAIFGI